MPSTRKRPRPKRPPSEDIFDLIGRSENIREASQAMQAMAHPLRLKILCLVGSQELSVLEIVEAVGTSQSNISQHLAVLRDNGILAARKDANRVYYRIGDPRVLKMISLTREIFCSF
jgi:ArsR family transcriptional regulator